MITEGIRFSHMNLKTKRLLFIKFIDILVDKYGLKQCFLLTIGIFSASATYCSMISYDMGFIHIHGQGKYFNHNFITLFYRDCPIVNSCWNISNFFIVEGIIGHWQILWHLLHLFMILLHWLLFWRFIWLIGRVKEKWIHNKISEIDFL